MFVPDLNLHLPELEDITLDKSGFHFQEDISIDLSNFNLGFNILGFNMEPTFFRQPAFDLNWFNGGGNGDGFNWNFSFDFNVTLPNSNGVDVTFPWLGVGFTDGLLLGNVDFSLDPPGLNFALGGNFGLGFDITRITGSLFNNGGSQGINIGLNGFLQLPEFMR